MAKITLDDKIAEALQTAADTEPHDDNFIKLAADHFNYAKRMLFQATHQGATPEQWAQDHPEDQS